MSITSLYRRNVGGLDRAFRLVVGVLAVAAGLLLAGGTRGEPLGIVLALAGLMILLTGITGRCPLYVPFGISTARHDEANAAPRPCCAASALPDDPHRSRAQPSDSADCGCSCSDAGSPSAVP